MDIFNIYRDHILWASNHLMQPLFVWMAQQTSAVWSVIIIASFIAICSISISGYGMYLMKKVNPWYFSDFLKLIFLLIGIFLAFSVLGMMAFTLDSRGDLYKEFASRPENQPYEQELNHYMTVDYLCQDIAVQLKLAQMRAKDYKPILDKLNVKVDDLKKLQNDHDLFELFELQIAEHRLMDIKRVYYFYSDQSRALQQLINYPRSDLICPQNIPKE